MSNQSQHQYPEGNAGGQPDYQFGQNFAASGEQASPPYAANGHWQQPASSSSYNSTAAYGSPYTYNYGAQQPPQPTSYYNQGQAGAYQPGVYGVPLQVQEENIVGTIALILSLGGLGVFFLPFVGLISWLMLAAGFVMGIVAVTLPNKKKLTGILAIVFSVIGAVVMIFVTVLAFLFIGFAGSSLEQDSTSDFYSSVSVLSEGFNTK